MSWNIFYVYQYETYGRIPYYIGKGSKNRINESHSPWVELPPLHLRKIIKNNLTEKEAFDLELELIKKYKRKKDGGILDNIKISRWVSQAGWKHSDEAKSKISKKNKGKLRSEDQKINYKKPKSKEHAEKIKVANLGRPTDIKRNQKIKETMKKKKWFTNGLTSVFCEFNQKPFGFEPGRIIKKD